MKAKAQGCASTSQGGEMVDTHGLGPCAVRHGGSTPLLGTWNNYEIDFSQAR
jgi:hypothetical protein